MSDDPTSSSCRQPIPAPLVVQPASLDNPPQQPFPLQLFTTNWALGMMPVAALHKPIVVRPAPHQCIVDVLQYFPANGTEGTKLTVEILFHSKVSRQLRISVGRYAVTTGIRRLGEDKWALEAAVPQLAGTFGHSVPAITVPITVQALDNNDTVVDSVTFGHFTYINAGMSLPSLVSYVLLTICYQTTLATLSITVPTLTTANTLIPISATGTQAYAPKPSSPPNSSQTADPSSLLKPHRLAELPRTPSPSLSAPGLSPTHLSDGSMADARPMVSVAPVAPLRHGREEREVDQRTTLKRSRCSSGLDGEQAAMKILSPLHLMPSNWTPAESIAGRRLVRFARTRIGKTIQVHAAPISQEEYDNYESGHAEEDMIVISCIARDGGGHCVTSVDIISLLEMLEGTDFEVEEKNRIRRNLDALQPTTVTKRKTGCASFFQRIMEYPKPRPRNIEKDIKVFDWLVLGEALDKIMSKKSIFISRTKCSPFQDATRATTPISSPLPSALPMDADLAETPAGTPLDGRVSWFTSNGGADVPREPKSGRYPTLLDGLTEAPDFGSSHYHKFDSRGYVPFLTPGTETGFASGWPFLPPVARTPLDSTERDGCLSSEGSEIFPGEHHADVTPSNLLAPSVPCQAIDDQFSILSHQYLNFD